MRTQARKVRGQRAKARRSLRSRPRRPRQLGVEPIREQFHAVCASLGRAQIRYAICRGVAVTIHGATRSTKDIDILIASADVDKALDAVRAIGYRFAALPLVFDENTAHARRRSPATSGRPTADH